MDIEPLFILSNLLVLPFWLLMLLRPRWHWTERIIGSPYIAAPVALLYALLVIPALGALVATLGNPTAAGIAQGLGTPQGALIGWAHFLTFDLLVGRHIYMDSRARLIHPLWRAFVLFATLMMGPIGYLLYSATRARQPSA